MIGLLGGTFDPVHHGHLRLAVEMREGLGLDEVRLIPAATPPHRPPPRATVRERREMLEAAVGQVPWLRVDGREIQRDGPSYTVDTLRSLRADFPDVSLCLILGMDAFGAVDTWHRWHELPALAHFAVARRPGTPAPGGVAGKWLREAGAATPEALRGQPAGLVHVQDVPPLDISASRVRALLVAGRDPRFLVPEAVLAYIRKRGLYIADD